MHFRMLPDHPKHGLKKDIFNVWSAKKRVLMHLHMLPDHPKPGLKKDIFQRLEWLKTCFEAFSHGSRPPGKKNIF